MTKINSLDNETTIAELRSEMAEFVSARDWNQFHSPKNLSMSLAIEAAELMEHFQWLEVAASRRESLEEGEIIAIGEEIADVLSYLLAICNSLNIDLASTFRRKLQLTMQKYPVENYRGRFKQ